MSLVVVASFLLSPVCVWQGRANPRSLLFKNRDHRLDVTIDFTCQAFSYLKD